MLDFLIILFSFLCAFSGYKEGIIKTVSYIFGVIGSYFIVKKFIVDNEVAFVLSLIACVVFIVAIGVFLTNIIPFYKVLDKLMGAAIGFFAGFFGGGLLITSIFNYFGKSKFLDSSIIYKFISNVISK